MKQKPSKSKYGNRKAAVDGVKFDSCREAYHYRRYIDLLEKGKIRDLVLQPKFDFPVNGKPLIIRTDKRPNGTRITYRADFSFYDVEKGCQRYIDVKGMSLYAFKLKRALMEAVHGINIEVVK